jgi:hypothetical protein
VQVRGALKMRSPKAKRIRSINKNKAVVDTLNRYFPQDRSSFGKGERARKVDVVSLVAHSPLLYVICT